MCVILACVVTFDLFTHPDRSITFDGRVHITTISMYHDLMARWHLPIVWVDAWGNYGYPLGLVSYQTTSYIGGLLQFMTGSPVMAYNLLFWISTFFSGVLLWIWLHGHMRTPSAIVGTVLFLFSPYRIQNIYVRGALPEYVSSVFVLMVLIGVQRFCVKRDALGFLFIVLGVALLAFTHPMMLVTGSLLLVPYTLLWCWEKKTGVRALFAIASSAALGLMLASYYILPLLTEIKYFYYGVGDKLRPSGFLSLQDLLSPFAPYFGSSHPGPPGVALRLGVIEAVAIGAIGASIIARPRRHTHFFLGTALLTIILIALVLPISQPLFSSITFLNNLQYPSRILSVITIIVPLLIGLFFDLHMSKRLMLVLVAMVCVTRAPQLYGKNYILTPQSDYQFTITNLHTKNMAPIWAGESAEYPRRSEKIGIIGGQGTISHVLITNSERTFTVNAQTPTHMADYTFFFPGWKAYVDGKESLIEFQDPNYRGVITYRIPSGEHQVRVTFIPTRIRKLGWLISLLSLGAFVLLGFFLMRKQNIQGKL